MILSVSQTQKSEKLVETLINLDPCDDSKGGKEYLKEKKRKKKETLKKFWTTQNDKKLLSLMEIHGEN